MLSLACPIAFVAVCGVACGGGGAQVEERAPDGTTPLATAVEPSRVAVTGDEVEGSAALFEPVREFTTESRRPDETRLEWTLGVGFEPQAVSELPVDFVLPGACALDPERDAVLPARLTILNTTDGFSINARIGVQLYAEHPDPSSISAIGAPTGLESMAVDAGADYDCLESSVASTTLQGPLANYEDLPSGETRTKDLAVIYRDYFTPGAPEGRKSDFTGIVATFTEVGFEGPGISFGETMCFSGPGVLHDYFSLFGEPLTPETTSFLAGGPTLPQCQRAATRLLPLADESAGATAVCSKAQAFSAVGSGNRSRSGNAIVDEVTEVFTFELLRPEREQGAGDELITTEAIDYPAESIRSLTGVRAATRTSGPYHRSVEDGKTALREQLAEFHARCPAVPVVLSGYSQGAQIVADVYQEIEEAGGAPLEQIHSVVLFGDPKFNPAPGGRGASRGTLMHSPDRGGLLGTRGVYKAPNDHIRSYCHVNDPVCQGLRIGNPAAALRDHSTYDDVGEAADAGRWVSSRLRDTFADAQPIDAPADELDRIFLSMKAGDFSEGPAAEALLERLRAEGHELRGNAAFNAGILRYANGDCAGATEALREAAGAPGAKRQIEVRLSALAHAKNGCVTPAIELLEGTGG